MKKAIKIKSSICLMAMDSRLYICTSGQVNTPDVRTVTPFLDSEDNEIVKVKHSDDSLSEIASSGVENREFFNNAAAIAGGLRPGQFYVSTGLQGTVVKVVV